MIPPNRLIQTKVCGLRRVEDAQHALDRGADAIGVVMVPGSARCASLQQAKDVFACAPQRAKVLVLCNAELEEARQWILKSGADHVQLCGDETIEYAQSLPVPILRRIAVRDDAPQEIEAWRPWVRAFVLDHPSSPGGSGKTVDRVLARTLAQSAPVLLAGGLKPDNVAAAIAQVAPQGVDASSGLELAPPAAPGIKDRDKITRFLHAAQTALSRTQVSQ